MPVKKRKAATKKAVKQTKEVCIYGYAEETRDLVNSLAPDVEVWGINMAHMFLKPKVNLTRMLQIHPRDWSSQGQPATGYWGRPKAHFDFLKKFKGDVYMSYDEPDIPNCKVYPFERLKKKHGFDYFTSSFSYLMALAIDEKYDKIYLYGINLTAIDEYIHQKAGLEYLIGYAQAKGIQVIIPDASGLLNAPHYGISTREGTLQNHVSERLDRARDKVAESAANIAISQTMSLDIQHWDEFLGQIMLLSVEEIEGIPEDVVTKEQLAELGKKIRDTVTDRLERRRRVFSTMESQAKDALNSSQGRVQTEQHYLSLLGGVDYRAGALPELFFPNPVIASDIDPPEQQAV